MSLRVMTMDVGGHRKGSLVDLEADSPFFRWSQPAGGDDSAFQLAEDLGLSAKIRDLHPEEVPDEETEEWLTELAEETNLRTAQEVNDGSSDDEPSLDSEDPDDVSEGSSGSS